MSSKSALSVAMANSIALRPWPAKIDCIETGLMPINLGNDQVHEHQKTEQRQSRQGKQNKTLKHDKEFQIFGEK